MALNRVNELRSLLASNKVRDGHAILRAVGGITRYRIIVLLNNISTGLTVTDLSKILNATPSQVSHQIRILKKFHLVFGKEAGRTVSYRLNANKILPFIQ